MLESSIGAGRVKPPIVILAGSDRRPGAVPAGASGFHFMLGYKGADIRLGDRCLAQALIERVRACGAFGEIYLAGPERIYHGLVDCPILDADGHVGQNILAAIRGVQARHGEDARIAFIACDILPAAGELAGVASDLLDPAAGGAGGDDLPPVLALCLINADRPLGASAWKPKYRVHYIQGDASVPFLPGHLGIAWPAQLRLGLLFRLLDLAYRYRNRDFDERPRAIILRAMLYLLGWDLLNLLRLKAPTTAYGILRHGFGIVLQYRHNELTIETLVEGLAAVLVRRRHYRRHGARSVRLVTSSAISLAKDIDTQEEFQELLEQIGPQPAP